MENQSNISQQAKNNVENMVGNNQNNVVVINIYNFHTNACSCYSTQQTEVKKEPV